ncbi:MAG: hypothetical protein D6731_03055 [Planctomycetota bacterium]|nr:MAG: hypothetical protein D6731_03055 [Planctomycetota bacterium]
MLPAPSYRELPNLRRGPNASFESRIDELREDVPAPTDPVVVDEDQRRAAAAALADRRAYEGAPPLVPHPVDAQDVAACLVCHEAGKDVDGVLAPAVPHGHELGNCTQCHAPPAPTFFAAAEPPPANTFEGARAPLHGERAHPLAPPVIPHATLMREDCRACHGVRARPGLRTTHPWRVNCTQCHASGTGFAR